MNSPEAALARRAARVGAPTRPPIDVRRAFILTLVILAGVLNYVDRQAIAVLKPVIEKDLAWSDRDYGRLASLFQFAAAVGFIFAGRIVDRLGVKWANPAGVAAWSLAAMSHGLAATLTQFSLARVALGFTESLGTPTGIKTIASLFAADQRAWAIGLANSASNLGAIATPLAVPALALAFGWRAAFVGIGALGMVWVLAWLGATVGMARGGATADAPSAGPSTAAPIVGSMFRDRRTWAIAGAKALSDQVWWLLLFWTPDFLHRVFGLGLARMAAPLAVIYACAATGSILAGLAATALLRRGVRVGVARKGAMLVCALLVTPAPLALRVHDYWLAVGLIGLMLAAHQGFAVNLFALVADIVPAPSVGRVTSFGSLCGNLAGMAIVFAAGELLARGQGYGGLFAVAACSYLLAVAWIQTLLPAITPIAKDGRH
jgi:ACS family hexuronate transporter-like MFS transporter